MAFVINKIGPLYSGLINRNPLNDFINNNVKPFARGVFGTNEPQDTGVNLKIDSLANVLKGAEKEAVVLEEYVKSPGFGEGLGFKYNKNKGPLNQDMSNLGGGRFFVFVEYRDDQQALRGSRGYGNMIMSTRGPIKFNGQQSLPDVSMPGAGSVVMDMGPADSYINFEGSFLFQKPDESIAWLENARLHGLAFVFHYKRWHRFVRIQRLSFDIINDNHIDFQIGLKVMGFDDKDINNIITSGKKKTRLERLAVAEMALRSQAAIVDAVFGILGINDLEDIADEFVDQYDRLSSFVVSINEGFANSASVSNEYLSSKSSSLSIAKRADAVRGHAAADTQKYVSSAKETNDFINESSKVARGIL